MNQKVIGELSRDFGSKSFTIGVQLLGSVRRVNDVEVEVRNRALPTPQPLTNSQKFKTMLENYVDRHKSVPEAKEKLIKASKNARVWGGAQQKMNEASVDDQKPLKHIIDAMVTVASHKYIEICCELFNMSPSQIAVMAGSVTVSSSDVLSEILWQWKTEKESEATIDALFRACKNAGIGGAVETMFDEIEKDSLT